MTDDGTRATAETIREKVLTFDGAVAIVGIVALIIGLFVSSTAIKIICGVIVLAAGAYMAVVLWGPRSKGEAKVDTNEVDGSMKKLFFDDYQSDGGKNPVREMEETDEKVVPSSKTTTPVPLKEETLRELQVLDFFDLDTDETYAETEPRSEFHSLLNKVLLVLKDVLFAHSVAFFWVNKEKEQLVLESMATDDKHFMSGKRLPLEEDILSQVAATGKPRVLGRVNPSSEQEVLRYYEIPAAVNSLVCVPIFFREGAAEIHPVGVIVADSKAEDAFGQETVSLLGRVTKLVSALIKSYTDKYDLLLESELLSSIRRMQDRAKSDCNEDSILETLIAEANRLAGWDFLTVTMYADEKHGWEVQKVLNKTGDPYVGAGQHVHISESVAGNVIQSNTVEIVHDITGETRPRFAAGEHINSAGSFLCVPISSVNRCYGAFSLESKTKSNFSGNEVETIYRLVENAAAALEVRYMNDLVKDYVSVDQLTGSLTKKFFLKKIEEEVRRAEDFGTELAFVSMAVDALPEHLERYGKEGVDAILNDMAKIVRANLRPYDVLGRQDEEKMGVLMIATAASDAYLWAEKVRKLITSHVITSGTKSFSVTVSAGVCGLTEGMKPEELVAGTTQVLGKAIESGGNLVRVF